MIQTILMAVSLILAVIFLLGYIFYLLYILFTPIRKLSNIDFNRRKFLFKIFKK